MILRQRVVHPGAGVRQTHMNGIYAYKDISRESHARKALYAFISFRPEVSIHAGKGATGPRAGNALELRPNRYPAVLQTPAAPRRAVMTLQQVVTLPTRWLVARE